MDSNFFQMPPQQGQVFGIASQQAMRPITARERLERLRDSFAADVDAVQALLDLLPTRLSPEQEEALQRLFTGPTER